MRKVIIIGSGNMGAGIAAIFLAFDFDVVVLGRDPQKIEARFPGIRTLSSSINEDAKQERGTLTAGTIERWSDWADTEH